MVTEGWIDRLVRSVSPRWAFKRSRYRAAYDTFQRHYEAASTGRRTKGWRRSSGDANASVSGALSRLRDHARDLVRNNAHARSALNTIGDHAVGWGIVPSTEDDRASELWEEWAGTTACDADGRNDFYGLQKLAIRTVAEAGSVLVRRRFRRPEDGLPIPLQIQLLEPDFIDTTKTTLVRNADRLEVGRVVQGVEFDAIGRRVAYWLYPEHPGSDSFFPGTSRRVPAESVLHIYRQDRPGQVHGVSWFAPVILTLKQFDEYTDAQLMKQLIAACLSVIVTDPDGTGTPLGVTESGEDVASPELDRLGAGSILTAPPGREVTVVEPPRIGEFRAYSQVTLRTIATGLGINYEDLTGDYGEMSFSAARLSRLRHWSRVQDWRWQLLVPQMCDPVWAWAMEVATIFRRASMRPAAEWTAPPLPMIEPEKEGLAAMRNVRAGITSLSEVLRERGFNPKRVLSELKADLDFVDELGLVLDSDARKMTQGGQLQGAAANGGNAEPTPGATAGEVSAAAAILSRSRKSSRKMNGATKR